VEGKIKDILRSVKFLNCYAPYKDRESFWQPLANCGFLKEEISIMVGDLNLIVSSLDLWGSLARVYPFSEYFFNLFTSVGLVDLQPNHLVPTWRNDRSVWLESLNNLTCSL